MELAYCGEDDPSGTTDKRARIVTEDDGDEMAPATAATIREDAQMLPDTDNPANVLIAALQDQMQAIEERVQTLEDRANAGEVDRTRLSLRSLTSKRSIRSRMPTSSSRVCVCRWPTRRWPRCADA